MAPSKVEYLIEHVPTDKGWVGESTTNVLLVEDLFNLSIESETSYKVKLVRSDTEVVIPYNVLKDCVLLVYK